MKEISGSLTQKISLSEKLFFHNRRIRAQGRYEIVPFIVKKFNFKTHLYSFNRISFSVIIFSFSSRHIVKLPIR